MTAGEGLYAAVEAGGTKFVCGLGDSRTGSIVTATIPTTDPGTTLSQIADFFRSQQHLGPVLGVGIGSFGPLDLDRASPGHGCITRTPKAGWSGFNLLGAFADMLAVPAAIDTDVNAAALAEARAAGPDIASLAYVTVGTGIGVGIVVEGKPVHGIAHPEAGHLIPRRHPAHGDFPGICPFHGDCMEGLASGPAVSAAWGTSPGGLPQDHAFWDIEPYYLAQLCVSLFLTMAPARIVLGGGVMQQARLFPAVRRQTLALLAGYVAAVDTEAEMTARIVAPLCAEPPGLIGAYILAEQAA